MIATNQSWQYKNITAITTGTLVRTGKGVLHAITLNKPVATSVITVYDNTAASGTVIGTITVPASPLPVTLMYDVNYSTGLEIVVATAASDITIAFS